MARSDTSQSTTRRSQRTPSTPDSAPAGLTEADIPRIVQEVLNGMPQARGNNSVHNERGLTVEDDEFSEDDSIPYGKKFSGIKIFVVFGDSLITTKFT